MSESKKSKSRRSSILKPAKPRNPLSDVDLKTPIEITFSRLSRRVSFASSNIIKEFTSDPEKNTIWHNSYEEEINKSDTNSIEQNQQLDHISIENMYLDSDEFNCTKTGDIDNSFEVLLANNSLENSITSATVELIPVDICNQVPNIPLDQPNFQEIRQSILFNQNEGNVEIIQPNVLKTKRQTILYNQCPEANVMELTQVLTENATNITSQTKDKRQTIIFKCDSEDCKMDLTQVNIQTKNHKRQTIIFNQETGNVEENRIVLTEKEAMFLDKENVKSKRQTVHYNQMSDDGKMNMTKGLPADYIVVNNPKQIIDTERTYKEIKKSKRQTINFNQMSDNANMEITEVLPTHFVPNSKTTGAQEIDKENKKSKRQTINFNQTSDEANMEMTEVFPENFIKNVQNFMVQESDKENIKSKRHTINFNQMSDNGNMEMTEVLPTHFILNNKKPQIDSQEINKESKLKRQTINYNQTSDEANMEMTKVLPAHFISNVQNIMVLETDKENIQSKRHTINFNQISDDANMEMTEVLPAHFVLNNKKPKTTAQEINTENKKFKRQTINFNPMSDDANMEMTEVLPAHFIPNVQNIMVQETDKENIQSKRHTINFNQMSDNANMEITEVLPQHCILNNKKPKIDAQEVNKENGKSKRQTINYNQTSDEANMEMTEVSPAHFISNVQNIMVQETDKENIQSKRHTINFNQMSDNANMEMTEVLPAHFVLNNKKTKTTAQEINTENKKFKRQTINFNPMSDDANMEMTEVLPTHCILNNKKPKIDAQEVNKENRKSKRQTINYNQTSDEANMEITEVLPAHFIPNVQNIMVHETDKENINSKRQTNNFNQMSDDGNMEMTEVLPARFAPNDQNMVLETNKENNKSKRQTINFNQISDDANMEITEILPGHFVLNNKTPKTTAQEIKKLKRQTINYNPMSDDANMEMTEVLPAGYVSNNNDALLIDKVNKISKRQTIIYNQEERNLEETKVVLNEQEQTCFDKENVKSKRQTIHYNKLSDDANMEMTKIVGINDLEQELIDNRYMYHIKNWDEESMAMTGVFPNFFASGEAQKLNKEIVESKRQTINFNQLPDDGNMEITEFLPSHLIPNNKVQKFNETNEENVKSKRQTINFNQTSDDANMEMTEVLPAHFVLNNKQQIFNKENIKSKRQTINFNQMSADGNMEIIEVLPAHFVPNEQNNMVLETDKENVKFKRQTINFNQISDDANMEITEVLPAHFVPNNQNMILETDKENIKSKRLTINLNQMSDDANMEMTEISPAYFIPQNEVQIIDNQETNKENINSKLQTINYNDNIKLTKTLQSSLNNRENIKPINVKKIPSKKKTEINEEDKENCPIVQNSVVCDSKINKDVNLEMTSVVPLNATGYFLSRQLSSNQLELKTFEVNNAIKDTILKMTDTELLANESTNPVEIYFQENKSENADKNNDISSKLSLSERLKNNENDPKNVDLNESDDICQMILLPGQETHNKVVVEKLELTPANHNLTSFNSTKNLSSFVDSTEKLIAYKINEISVSEYSKIINEDVDINSSEVQKEMLSQSADSIITINSSVEIDNSFNLIEKELSEIYYEIKKPEHIESDDEDNFGSLKSFVNKSFGAFDTIHSQNVSLVDSPDSSNSFEKNPPIVTAEEILHKFVPKSKSTNENLYQFCDQNDFEIGKKTANLRTRFKELCQKLNPVKEIKVLTLEDKIKKRICKDSLWNFVNSDNEEFNFTYMNDAIKFVVFIDRATEIVRNVNFSFHINESKSRPVGIYVHNILKNKLKESHISSACGADYSILSLLDYLTIIGEQMMDICYEFNDLELQHGMVLDRDYNATFQFRNYVLLIAFEVSLNINNLENMTEKNVIVKPLIGKVDEITVKQLVKGCPLGVPLLKAYVLSIKEYIKVLQRTKKG